MSEAPAQLPAGARDPELDRWDAWTPRQVVHVLGDVDAPWYVAAGWALSLHLGHVHRPHEDLEVAVPASRFAEVAAALADYDLFVPGKVDGVGFVRPLEVVDAASAVGHQTWVRDRASGAWRLDVFREPSAGGEWVCRRDESLRLPYERVIVYTEDGIPYVRPEIALLFKAKQARPKDDADLEVVLPTLDAAARSWLLEQLERIHPGHPWIDRVDENR